MSSQFNKKEITYLTGCPNTKLQYVLQQRENANELVFWLKF